MTPTGEKPRSEGDTPLQTEIMTGRSGRSRGSNYRPSTSSKPSPGPSSPKNGGGPEKNSKEKSKETKSTGKPEQDKGTTNSELERRLERIEEALQKLTNLHAKTNKDTPTSCTPADQTLGDRLQIVERIITETSKNTNEAHKEPKRNIPKPKRKFLPINYESLLEPEHFDRYFTIQFESEEHKKKTCPYKLREKIVEATGMQPRAISTSGRSAFTIETRNKEQSKRMTKIENINGIPCKTTLHKNFNHSKGLVYIYQYDLSETDDFILGMKEDNENIIDIQVASFIKAKKGSQALLITFNRPQPPSFLDIPGERAETRVFPFRNKPMRCKKCQEYNHTIKRCNKDVRCEGCSLEGHSLEGCPTPDLVKCLYCGNNHKTGDKSCPNQKKEVQISEIQEKMKIGRRAAIQKLYGENFRETVTAQNNQDQPKYFTLTFTETSNEKSTNPYQLLKAITSTIGSKPKTIRRQGENYVITIDPKFNEKILQIRSVSGSPCTITKHSSMNSTTGLIYTYDILAENSSSFMAGLKSEYNLEEIKHATWIKPRNKRAIAFLVTFQKIELPEFIVIPGEQSKTKVYPYIPKPMRCRKCQDYLHTMKYCESSEIVCGKCSEAHLTETCTSSTLKCFHCNGAHEAGNRRCPKERTEQEIKAIQIKKKMSRRQAIISLEQTNPSYEMQYSRAVQGTLQNPHQPNSNQNEARDREQGAVSKDSEETLLNHGEEKERRRGDENYNTSEPGTSKAREGEKRQMSDDESECRDAAESSKRAKSLAGQTVLVTTTPSRSEGTCQPMSCDEPIHFRSVTLTEEILESQTTRPNLEECMPPPTPEHATSENDATLREQSEQIFNEGYHLPQGDTQGKSSSNNVHWKDVRFKPFAINKQRKYRQRNRSN